MKAGTKNGFPLLMEILLEFEPHFCQDVKRQSIQQVAQNLNITPSTINRWLLLEDVPKEYYLDLLLVAGREVDYTQFSYREKDQFFTPRQTARYCIEKFKTLVSDLGVNELGLHYIEPSAGSGSFLKSLPPERRTGLDIEPRHSEVICANYLKWKPAHNTNNVVIGNPPFGLRGHTALRFINHSYDFADFVVFILPQFFQSDGKGTPMKRVKGFNLIHSESLDTDFENPEGDVIAVNTVFQVWSKHFDNNEKAQSCKKFIKVYSLSDGGTPSKTRNKNLIGKCDAYIPSTCFGADKMRVYESFGDLPNEKGYGVVFLEEKQRVSHIFNNIDWAEESFKSTNSALNLRTSLIEKALIKHGVMD